MTGPSYMDSSLFHASPAEHLPTAPRPDNARDQSREDVKRQLADLDQDDE